MKKLLAMILVLTMLMGAFGTTALAATLDNPGFDTEIVNLRTDGQVEPINVEPNDKAPLTFSWEMQSAVLGQAQAAYQIVVKDENGNQVWNSGKVDSGVANNIAYEGEELAPDTGYTWDLTVWDVYGAAYGASASFETSKLSKELSAWNGANFVGIEKQNLDADSLFTYDIFADVKIVEGSTASLVFAGNDFRMSNQYQNKWKIDGSKGNYARIELDISGLAEGGKAKLNMYAPGYDNANTPDVPVQSWNVNGITAENAREAHTINISETTGRLTIKVDGAQIYRGKLMDNFYTSHNNNVFPHLNDVGVGAKAGDKVEITNYYITDRRTASKTGPNMVLLAEDVGAGYGIFAEPDGKFIDNGGTVTVADGVITVTGDVLTYSDPSYYGMTMLRKEFTASKPIADAKLFVTAMGAADVEINGEAVAPENYFEPGFSMFRETMYYTAYDVTDYVKEGENAIGATLNSGWYTGYMTYSVESNYSLWGDYEALLADLVITYEDGTVEHVVSDTTWEGYKESPLRYGNMYQGEYYDANYEAAVEGYSTVAYDSSAWTEEVSVIELRDWIVNDVSFEGDEWGLYARQDAPVHVYEVLTAQRVVGNNDAASGTFTYDMGTNMVGVPEVTFPTTNMKVGDKVRYRFAEHLFPGLEGEINYHYRFDKTYNPDGSRQPNGDEFTKNISWADIYGNNPIHEEGDRSAGLAGRIMTDTYRGAMAIDTYVVSQADIDRGYATYAPSATFRGYQYVQVTVPGTTEPLPLENVKGIVLSSNEPISATYHATAPAHTIDPWGKDATIGDLVNQLYANITRSQVGNTVSLPTDCPQRNERMGWTGDAQVYALMGSYASDSFNFWNTWMQSLRDIQTNQGFIGNTSPDYSISRGNGTANSTTWAAAVCMVPWMIYTQYGNTTVVTEYADTMFKWLDGNGGGRLTAAMATDDPAAYLATATDTYSFMPEYPNLRASKITSGHCDHLARDSANSSVVNNAMLIFCMDIASIMFDAVGDPRAEVIRAWYEVAKTEWNTAFIDDETGMTYDFDMKTWDDTQTSYATPLNFNVFSDEMTVEIEGVTYTYKEFAAKRLAELVADPGATKGSSGSSGLGSGQDSSSAFLPYTIVTGFSGTPNILDALSANGNNVTAYKLFQNTEYASWLYPVANGAQTVYERWNSYQLAFDQGIDSSNSMNSFNHFALGAAGSWMFEYQLGITNDTRAEDASYLNDPGYKNFVLQPMPGPGFTALEGSYVSNYGEIKSAWTTTNETDGLMATYAATVPANTTATLYLPVGEKAVNVPEELTPFVKVLGAQERYGATCTVLELTAGAYNFTIGETVEVAVEEGYIVPEIEAGTGVTLNLTAPETAVVGEELVYTLTAADAIDLATATLTFEVEGVEAPVVAGVNGWEVITQSYEDGILTAVLYNLDGVTAEGEAVELATVSGVAGSKPGAAVVTLTAADLSAYVGNGEAFVGAVLADVEATIEVKYSVYDVNQDGIVNQLDITRAQRFFGKADDLADVDDSGEVDITDLVLILNNYS